MLREGPDGFSGGLSAGNYVTITGASPATATRDLTGLLNKGVLLRAGERRHARYHVAIPMQKISPVVIDVQGEFRVGKLVTSPKLINGEGPLLTSHHE